MNLKQFERTKSELKRSFYQLNKINGKTIILRKRILNWERENTLSGLENVFGKNRKGLRVKSLKSRGVFCKTHGRRGILQLGLLDRESVAQIRSRGGVKAGQPELG